MRTCTKHWQMFRDAIETRGMSGLVAQSGEQAVENMTEELQGGNPAFDPLMSMHWHWTNSALRSGGLYLMDQNESGENDGHYCPVCEFEKHQPEFKAQEAIGQIADQMAEYARTEKLIPRPS